MLAAIPEQGVSVSFPQNPASSASAPYQLTGPPPVQFLGGPAAPQRRLTVLFRAILVIPQAFVLFFLGIGAVVVAFLGWWGALFMGYLPDFATSYLTGYARWYTRVQAYMLLLTDAYPPFSMDDDPGYPARIATTRERLNRAAVFFRFILVVPAYIVALVLSYGALTIVLFVTWVITLINGSLPDALHLAYTAVLRYQVRYYCYSLLLTPTYPVKGLLGDGLAAGPQPPVPPAGPVPGAGPGYGYGTPGDAYGAPGGYTAPEGYGAPGGYTAPEGYAAPGGYGETGYDTPGYTAPGGYAPPGASAPGAPGYGQPGYGTPGSVWGAPNAPGAWGPAPGYGPPPPADAGDPAGWRLVLTPAARKLMIFFIVFGAVVGLGEYGFSTAADYSTVNNLTTAGNAIAQINGAYNTLNGQVTNYQSAVSACNGQLKCLTNLDSQAEGYFSAFASKLQATAVPSSAAQAKNTLYSDSRSAAQDLSQLSQATSASAYQSTLSSTGLEQTLNRFDTDYNALGTALNNAL